MFYNVHLSKVKEGLKFHCELKPYNPKDVGSIVLKCSPTITLGLLAREASAHLSGMDFLLMGEFYFLLAVYQKHHFYMLAYHTV